MCFSLIWVTRSPTRNRRNHTESAHRPPAGATGRRRPTHQCPKCCARRPGGDAALCLVRPIGERRSPKGTSRLPLRFRTGRGGEAVYLLSASARSEGTKGKWRRIG